MTDFMQDGVQDPYSGYINASVGLFAQNKPFEIVRGNHETRGNMSRHFMDYVPHKSGHIYNAYRWGDLEIVLLDSGEDKLDNHQEYYGMASFYSYREEMARWFEELIKLSGLGPKIALNILATYSCEEITEAIFSNNCEFFSSISGIGAKLANRLPVEMKKQIEKINQKVMEFNGATVVRRPAPIVSKQKAVKNSKQVEKTLQFEDNKKSKKTQNSSVINDAVETLKTLGFTSQEVYKEVFKIAKNNDCTTEDIVKEFLKKK